MEDLKITLIQVELVWENIKANLQRFDRILDSLNSETDLVVLPEMFTTGFSTSCNILAESMDGQSISWMQDWAKTGHFDLVGSIIVKDHGNYYNRLLWVTPQGEIHCYDKKYLFRHAGEHHVYTSGKEKKVIRLKGWNIRPFICYDLRFPHWSLNHNLEYDLAIYVANWPKVRAAHWNSLLTGRAIENQAYVAGVNRIGRDGNNLVYQGDSSLIDPQGRLLYRCEDQAETVTLTLGGNELQSYRARFPVWKDLTTTSI